MHAMLAYFFRSSPTTESLEAIFCVAPFPEYSDTQEHARWFDFCLGALARFGLLVFYRYVLLHFVVEEKVLHLTKLTRNIQ